VRKLSERVAFTGAVIGLSLGFAVSANLAFELYRDLREGGGVACAHAPMLDNLEAPYRASLRALPLGVACTWADFRGDVTVEPGWGATMQAGAALVLMAAGGVAARAARSVRSVGTN
jgi:hypothetical protein